MADPVNPPAAPVAPVAPVAAAPAPGEPGAPTVAVDTSSASSSIAAQLTQMFGADGRLPDAVPLRAGESVASLAAAAATGPAATGATGPAATGATGPAATGATGPVETGATGPAATGATGPTVTDAALDKAEAGMDLQAGTAFKHVRSENKALAASLAEAKTALAEAQAAAAKVPEVDKTEFDRVKAQGEAAEKALAAVRFEATQEFQSTVKIPLDKAEASIRDIATRNSVPAGDLAAALAETDEGKRNSMLTELSANFNRFDLTRFDSAVVSMMDLKAKAGEILATASDRYQTLQAAQQADVARQTAEVKADWTKALDTSIAQLETEMPIFKPTGDAAWDKSVTDLRAKVRATDLAALPNGELASMLYKANVLPLVLSLVSDLHAKNTTAEERIAVLQGTAPAPGSGIAPVVVDPAKPVIDDKTTFADVLKQRLAGVLPP